MNSQQYLTAMGISVWQSRRTVSGAKMLMQFQTLQLSSATQTCFGYLLLDTSFDFPNETAVFRLLTAMMQAVNLKYSKVTMPENLLTAANKILIMGHTLAEVLLNSSKKNTMESSSLIMSTWHPADLLAQPQQKRQAWADLQHWMK